MLTWPFSTRASRTGLRAPTPSDLPQKSDYEVSEVTLKVWLPQGLVDRLNWLSAQTDMSRADVMRAILFKHLYGEIGYEALAPTQPRVTDNMVDAAIERVGNYSVPSMFPQPISDIQRSPPGDHHVDREYIGASTNNLPVELPRKMKEDIARLAKLEGLTRSQCIRKLLVLNLMGAIFHADWQRALGPIGADVVRLDAENEGL